MKYTAKKLIIFIALLSLNSNLWASKFANQQFKLPSDINAASVSLVSTAVFPASNLNTHNFMNGIQLGNLGLSFEGNESNIDYGLIIEFSGKKVIEAYRKQGDANYGITTEEHQRKKNVFQLALPSGTLSIKLSGFPCKSGTKCKLQLTSWLLNQLAKNGSFQSFPSLMTAILHDKGLELINTSQKKNWLSIPDFKPKAEYGKPQKAFTIKQGVLGISFQKGLILLDFPRDKIIFIDRTGVFLSSSSIGGLASAQYANSLASNSNNVKLIEVSSFGVLWTRGYLSYDEILDIESPLSLNSIPEDISMGHLFKKDRELYLLAKSNEQDLESGKEQLAIFSLSSDNPSKSNFIIETGNYIFINDYVYRLDSAGIYLYDTNTSKFVPTSLSVSSESVFSADGEHLLVQKEENSDCRWLHYLQNTKSAKSFLASGLNIPCMLINNLSKSKFGTSITSFDGLNIIVGFYYN